MAVPAATPHEKELIEAMTAGVGTGDAANSTRAQRRSRTVMRRFHGVLEANVDRPLFVKETAEAVGVSVKTLSSCCREHLGMGARKYLYLRRMHLVRRALLAATPADSSVTAVTTRYRMPRSGRFAANYEALFGELPSATLRAVHH